MFVGFVDRAEGGDGDGEWKVEERKLKGIPMYLTK